VLKPIFRICAVARRCRLSINTARRIVLQLVMLSAMTNYAIAQAGRPTVAIPENAHAFEIGRQLTVNGSPVHISGFISPSKPDELAAWFRKSLGQPLMENNLPGKLILGRADREYYLTVQLEAARNGTRGLIAISRLQTANERQIETQAQKEYLLLRLPAGSQVLSQISSQDGGRNSEHFVLINGYSEGVNRERIKSLMQDDGMVLEREVIVNGETESRLPAKVSSGSTLYFKGTGKEAIAVIYRDDSRTAIVLNTTSYLEPLK
jgi:hypothetical protein